MQAPRKAPLEPRTKQSLALLNQHLAAAVILQDRMRRSPRNLLGENFIMIDDMCDQVASLMETCTMLIADRLRDLGGTVRWPVLRDEGFPEHTERYPSIAGRQVNALPDAEPLNAITGGNGLG